ncbi:hypothetical protein [uncultured Bacteroides sp.]|uniref:hypothetical protein n=1 Tax=uncultured Bacteroides sp. TaxID=162156 RepID=UPI0025DA30DE|nr:hypothetical protein [uncultured Bacteroides sp.]
METVSIGSFLCPHFGSFAPRAKADSPYALAAVGSGLKEISPQIGGSSLWGGEKRSNSSSFNPPKSNSFNPPNTNNVVISILVLFFSLLFYWVIVRLSFGFRALPEGVSEVFRMQKMHCFSRTVFA